MPPPSKPIPMAYFITFSCYGHRIHGDETGSVDRHHNIAGTPFLPLDLRRMRTEQAQMNQPSYELDARRRDCVLDALQEAACRRGWHLLAAHVRSRHVHVVVAAPESAEKVLTAFKAYASRGLNQQEMERRDRQRWARHGSTRYLWKREQVERAINYVVQEQGEPMAVFENPNRWR